ncbi:MAG: DUF6305 family protein [Candidatus Neomarinimicrobiota bacterium]
MRKSILTFFMLMLIVSGLMAEDTKLYDQPVLITSAGQSADVKLVGMLAKKSGINATTINMAQVPDLENIKSLIIVPGYSSKGLGAAGVSQEDEMKRVTAIIEAAAKEKIPVILVHIGGKARRMGQSDLFISVVVEAARQMIVVQQGNEDGFFTKISEEKKIPLVLVEKIAAVADPLKAIFN